jgi:hypothetical protein
MNALADVEVNQATHHIVEKVTAKVRHRFASNEWVEQTPPTGRFALLGT